MQVGALLLLLTSLAHYRCGVPVPKLSGMAIVPMLIFKVFSFSFMVFCAAFSKFRLAAQNCVLSL